MGIEVDVKGDENSVKGVVVRWGCEEDGMVGISREYSGVSMGDEN